MLMRAVVPQKGVIVKKQSSNNPAYTSRGTQTILPERMTFQKDKIPLQKRKAGNRTRQQRIPETITATGILTIRVRKRADTAGANIRTGNARKLLILGATSKRRTLLFQRVQRRSFRAAGS